jgi:hypothetical protein
MGMEHMGSGRLPRDPPDRQVTYRTAKICLNGHLMTADVGEDPTEQFCSICGEAGFSACPKCKRPIKGDKYRRGDSSGDRFDG